jgi:spore germination protein YaaH
VDTIWKKPIVGVDDQITPMRYLARLSNGDTVPVANTTRIGDSIQYKFIKLKESSK